ncbi:D-alanine--D-alanine ligase [Pelagibius sp. Alg239-R121]|uniref:D-alanine--D-alanine ligase n=1 Tax=Pelagibius sp. Alg239-R121 TaxID=2993448 RepID=UPI0024A7722F|nr:D-alanine--D-alanine ligase [Pelagibius sp. Alg239-R121]
MTKRVTVLMGGFSAEREVSLTSGRACADALREAGYEVKEVDVSRDMAALIAALDPKPDVIFNALHGRWGEDGCIQGLMDMLGLRYTHSGVLASALAMNKDRTKTLAAEAGITVPHGVVVPAQRLAGEDVLPRPYVAKPLDEGSSVGVQIVDVGDNGPALPADSADSDDLWLVEEYIPGRELTVSVMNGKAIAVTELRPKVGFYTYEAKYTEGKTEHIVPAQIPEKIYEEALNAAAKVHEILGCHGVSRSDFRYDDTKGAPGKLYFLEINTQPGMTALSLVPEQAAYKGMSFPELCAWIVESAVSESAMSKSEMTESGIAAPEFVEPAGESA